jgi:hypothetical protein
MAFSHCEHKKGARWQSATFSMSCVDRVTSRSLYRFKDGLADNETTVFSQRGNFPLITNHHIYKVPSFPQPTDLSIDARRG